MLKIEHMAHAITEWEGYAKGSRSYRNKNPGNLRLAEPTGRCMDLDAAGHCIFATYEDGWDALVDELSAAVHGSSHTFTPDMTLLQFFETYAEQSEGYARFVADRLHVAATDQLKDLIG